MSGASVGVLCFVELDGDDVVEASLRAVTFARSLAECFDGPLVAMCVGEVAGPSVATLGAFGVSRLYQLTGEGLGVYSPALWSRALNERVGELGAECVVAAGTDRGHEVLAHVGATRARLVVANCVAGRAVTATTLGLTRQRWGGTLLEDVELELPLALLSVATDGVVANAAANALECDVVDLKVNLAAQPSDVRVAEWRERAGGIALADARVVVGGGRGVGGEEKFGPLEALAALLGGTVGVSRAVTSAGWRPHAQQVGQTGTRITPDLYLACGISGATQHLAGCRSAKHVVAINVDADAPMMLRADYAVVADMHTFLPDLIEAVRSRTSGK